MTDLLAQFSSRHGLLDSIGEAPDGLPHRSIYSSDMQFRYAYGRWWGEPDLGSSAVWVLLNPATGDTELRRRPTLERCIRWSRTAGHSGLIVVNLFAYRTTSPKVLKTAEDPVGPHNNEALAMLTATGAQTLAAWGAHGRWRRRSAEVAPLLDAPLCLGTTARGEPRHPLYVSRAVTPAPWTGPGRAGHTTTA